MRWAISWKADPRAKVLADRHYNRKNPESPQFVPPGRALVLLTLCAKALWVTSWPFAQYVRHAWAGAWLCSCFRNEGAGLSSELVREAVAASRWHFGEPPPLGLVTFVDPTKTRKKRDPGRCFRKAGFAEVGRTIDRDLIVLQMLPGAMPAAAMPIGSQRGLFRVEDRALNAEES